MSRVGKKPVPVPAGVTATVTGQTVAREIFGDLAAQVIVVAVEPGDLGLGADDVLRARSLAVVDDVGGIGVCR